MTQDPVVAEMMRTLVGASRQLGALPRSIQRTLEEIYESNQEAAGEFNKTVDSIVKGYGKDAAARKTTLLALNAQENALRKEVEKARDAIVKERLERIKANAKVRESTENLNRLQKEVQKATKAIADSKGTQEEQKHTDTLHQASRKLREYQRTHETLTSAHRQAAVGVQRASKSHEIYNKHLEQTASLSSDTRRQFEANTPSVMGQMAESFKGMLTKLVSTVSPAAMLGKSVGLMTDSIGKEIGAGVSLSFKDYMSTGFKLGMTPGDFAELTKTNREYMLATGGLTKSTDFLEQVNHAYASSIADNGERTKFAAAQMKLLAENGITPTVDAALAMKGSFDELQKSSSMTMAQLNDAISSVLGDTGGQSQLRGVQTQEQRRAIVEGTAKQLAANRALGMLPEKAIAAAKAMGKLGAEDPIERYKKAAKLRMAGAAMGIDVGDAAKALMLGDRLVPGSDLALNAQKQTSALSNKMGQASTGSQSGEFFTAALMNATGMQDVLGKQGPNNTTLEQASLAPSAAAINSLGEMPKGIVEANDWLQKIHNGLTMNPILMGIMGLVGVIATELTGKSLVGSAGSLIGKFGKGGKGLSKLFSRGAGAAGAAELGAAAQGELFTTGAAGVEVGASTVGGTALTAGGRMLKGVKGGIAGMLVGTAADYAADKLGRNTKGGAAADTLSDVASGAGTGALIGSVIPIVGTAVGAAVGGLAGGIKGMYDNWDTFFGSNKKAVEQGADATDQNVDVMQQQVDTLQQQLNLQKQQAALADATSKKIAELNDSINNQTKVLSMSDDERRKYAQAAIRNDNKFSATYAGVR